MQLSARGSLVVGVTALTFGLVACDPNVNYLRAGSGESGAAGGGGATTASGNGGTSDGGSSNQGGSNSVAGDVGNLGDGGLAGDDAGASATGGSATGGNATGGNATGGSAGSLCTPNQPRLVELFAFDEATPPVANVVDGSLATWQKGPYDSTDMSTGSIDSTATPPANPTNLANLSKLELDSGNGNPLPAMKLSIPFSGKNAPAPITLKPVPEHMHLIYIFAQNGQPANTVDFTARRFTADVKALVDPRTACQLTINAWTTGTNATATTFMHVDGPITKISSEWTQVTMDLATSTPKTAINQYGFAIDSTCPTTPVVPDGLQTVLLFDNIRTACE
ncbi:MAG TPA: hypothetical protein VGF76_26415 [Polyangiaceae bacterium]